MRSFPSTETLSARGGWSRGRFLLFSFFWGGGFVAAGGRLVVWWEVGPGLRVGLGRGKGWGGFAQGPGPWTV